MVVAVGSYTYRILSLMESRYSREERTKAVFLADIVKSSLEAAPDGGGHSGMKNFIATLSSEDISISLSRPDGGIVASSRPMDSIAAPEPGDSTPGLPQGGTGELRLRLYNEKPCQSCHGGEYSVLGLLSVTFSQDASIMGTEPLDKPALILTLSVILAISVSLFLALVLLVIRPMRNITAAAGKIAAGDYSLRFNENRRDEFGSLSRSLNTLVKNVSSRSHELEAGHAATMQKVERMATIGELASAIAHEIKNPLAGISGAIQVFAEDFPSGDPRKEIIMEVLSEIERLDKTVRDLMAFARPPEPHFIWTPVDSVVDRTLRLIKGHAQKLNIDVNIISNDKPVDVRIDPDQMQQVFMNIMMNGLHSMPAGGTLTVETEVRKKRKQVEVSIRDTGQGIPEMEVENIFKPFYTTKRTGTGLGLAVCKNIVEKHGGELMVESDMGKGTCFRVILPLEERKNV